MGTKELNDEIYAVAGGVTTELSCPKVKGTMEQKIKKVLGRLKVKYKAEDNVIYLNKYGVTLKCQADGLKIKWDRRKHDKKI